MLSAADMHAREARDLAPWAVRTIDAGQRAYPVAEDLERTAFQRDRDRIVHSRAFRRLAYKTQVFVNDQGDLFRSRLTHTMELVQVARSVARRLQANEDLVECVALAHDLGHPPFGHRGEDMLADLLADYGGFDHHHQALRIVEDLEQRYPEHPGLNLTDCVRDSLAKLGCCTQRDRVPARYDRSRGPVLEAQLVDELDSITYLCHDIDDGLRAGILDFESLAELELWRGAYDEAVSQSPASTSQKLLTDRALRIVLDACVSDLVEGTQRRLQAEQPEDVAAVTAMTEPLVVSSPSMRAVRDQVQAWLVDHLYRDWRINRRFNQAQRIISDLFAFFVQHPDTLPDEHQERVELLGRERAVADYIAGMTDRYAGDTHRELMGSA